MHRRALIFLLALGTVTGYASGFASLHRWHRYGPGGSCRHGQSHSGDDGNHGPSATQGAAPQAQAPTAEPR